MRHKISWLLAVVFVLAACGESGELAVKEVSPSKGPYIGGEPVRIKGTGFKPTMGVKVYFGGKAAPSPVVESETEIRVEPPGGEVNEQVDVLVVFDDSKQAVKPKAYTYIDPTGASGFGGQPTPPPRPSPK